MVTPTFYEDYAHIWLGNLHIYFGYVVIISLYMTICGKCVHLNKFWPPPTLFQESYRPKFFENASSVLL